MSKKTEQEAYYVIIDLADGREVSDMYVIRREAEIEFERINCLTKQSYN